MPRHVTITQKALEAIDKKLAELPEVKPEQRQLSMRESIDKLKPRIRELRAKGYSIDMVAEQLSLAGLKVKPSTVKLYARGLHTKTKKQNGSKT